MINNPRHRHPEDHNCHTHQPPSSHQRHTQHKILAPPTAPPRRGGARSESLAAKVALMKLKQKADGLPSIPQVNKFVLCSLFLYDVC